MATPIKAQIAVVNLGHIQVEGLLASNAKFYVAVPQIASHFQFDTNQASRGIKAALGEGFQFAKLSTPLNPKAVNALSLEAFDRLVVQLAFKGHLVARQMVEDLFGLSLYQLFCDAFGIAFEKEERAQWLQARIESKRLFWDLTQAIKTWTESRECSAPIHTYYSNAFDCLNLQLFDMKSKDIREELGVISPDALNRDHFGRDAILNISMVQKTAARRMSKDVLLKPTDAIKQSVEANFIDVGDFRV